MQVNELKSFVNLFFQFTEVWTTILGAVIAALTSYYIQSRAFKENQEIRQAENNRENQVLGNSLIIKMNKIYSTSRGFDQHFNNDESQKSENLSSNSTWLKIVPYGTYPQTVLFKPEELSLLMAQEDNDIYNNVCILDEIHAAIIDTAKLYAIERGKLLEELKPTSFNNDIGLQSISSEQLSRMMPQIVIVNSVLFQLQDHAKKLRHQSRNALYELHALLKEKLDLTYDLETVDD